MSLCSDATQKTGDVGLFLGVETASWGVPDFQKVVNFCTDMGIKFVLIKVSEVGSPAGQYWYGGIEGFDTYYQTFKKAGIEVIPYSFVYGDFYGTISQEIDVAKTYLQKYGMFCLDMEQKYWVGPNGETWAKQFNDTLLPVTGMLFVSCPADPVINNQLGFLKSIAPATNVFMPMAYSDYLFEQYPKDFPQVGNNICVQPTLDLSTEFGTNNQVQHVNNLRSLGVTSFTLWDYSQAIQNTSLIRELIDAFRVKETSLILNKNGEVANFINVSQFGFGHDEYACGPFAVSHVKFAVAPSVPNTHSIPEIQTWAYTEYANNIGPDTPSDTQGSTIPNMYTFYKDAGLHYYDMPVNANSTHSDDIARIKGALSAGYPVIATVAEVSVFDMGLGRNPYSWGPSGNHIIVYTGIAKNGNLLTQDTANVTGLLQGNNTAEPGPREYDISKLDNSYAAIIQTSWLKTIPSGDPLTWEAGYNAQNLQGGANVPTETSTFEKEALQVWGVCFTTPSGTGIYASWLQAWNAHNLHFGPPLTGEIHSQDSTGKNLIIQIFAHATCEWSNGTATWYDGRGIIPV